MRLLAASFSQGRPMALNARCDVQNGTRTGFYPRAVISTVNHQSSKAPSTAGTAGYVTIQPSHTPRLNDLQLWGFRYSQRWMWRTCTKAFVLRPNCIKMEVNKKKGKSKIISLLDIWG